MKRLLLILPLAACAPHVDPCLRPIVEIPRCVEMDRADRPLVHGDAPDNGGDGDYNGAGSASSDAVSDDSNGDGSDE
jgi:hypothetical protein